MSSVMSSISMTSPTLKLNSSLSRATRSHTASAYMSDVAMRFSEFCGREGGRKGGREGEGVKTGKEGERGSDTPVHITQSRSKLCNRPPSTGMGTHPLTHWPQLPPPPPPMATSLPTSPDTPIHGETEEGTPTCTIDLGRIHVHVHG